MKKFLLGIFLMVGCQGFAADDVNSSLLQCLSWQPNPGVIKIAADQLLVHYQSTVTYVGSEIIAESKPEVLFDGKGDLKVFFPIFDGKTFSDRNRYELDTSGCPGFRLRPGRGYSSNSSNSACVITGKALIARKQQPLKRIGIHADSLATMATPNQPFAKSILAMIDELFAAEMRRAKLSNSENPYKENKNLGALNACKLLAVQTQQKLPERMEKELNNILNWPASNQEMAKDLRMQLSLQSKVVKVGKPFYIDILMTNHSNEPIIYGTYLGCRSNNLKYSVEGDNFRTTSAKDVPGKGVFGEGGGSCSPTPGPLKIFPNKPIKINYSLITKDLVKPGTFPLVVALHSDIEIKSAPLSIKVVP